MEFEGKSILITGGTGSLGMALTKYILNTYPKIHRLIIFSRDEQKQFNMSRIFPVSQYSSIRYFIGDVRDYERLIRAFNGVDYVIHAAAMKHVPIAEYNPDECVKTNVNGAQNVIRASLESSVSSVVALSTDKACAPVNLYGATKLTSDKLFVAANNIKGKKDIKFSVVRYGNVMGSNGSVIPFFNRMKETGHLTITDSKMTRFNILIEQGVEMVIDALINAWGGEIFIPKIPSYNIMDLADAICPNCEKKIIGIRPGEKIHEEMISYSDSFNTFDLGKNYAIIPVTPKWSIKDFIKNFNAKKVDEGFNYSSESNKEFLTVEEIKNLIKKI